LARTSFVLCFIVTGPRLWNSLPTSLRHTEDMGLLA